jgi:diguanylate cyclase (GGDEF)-like protein/PAS domain S-box-containing protein
MNLSSDSFFKIADSLHDGLYFVDSNMKIIFWNKWAEKISGFSEKDVIDRPCSDNLLTHVDAKGDPLCFGGCPLARTIADGHFREAEVYMHHKDGHRVPVSVRVNVLTDFLGKVIGGIELFTDMTKHYDNELRIQELEKMALLDQLTQLANRRYIEKEINNILKEKKRADLQYGFLIIDIDHFKQVNDVYGHDVGDDVLKYVAKTFEIHSRPLDIYGRWGGEEFVGIICNTSLEDLNIVGNRLRMQVRNSYLAHNGKRLSVTISVGATMIKDDDTRDTLLKRADILLYNSKRAGRDCLTIK